MNAAATRGTRPAARATGSPAGLLPALLIVLGVAVRPALAVEPGSEPRWWGHDAPSATVPFPSIHEPIGSWVYDEVERQFVQGNLAGIHVHTRPLSRALIADRVGQALARGKRSVGLDRLARELAWEGRMMGLDFPYPDTRPWITLGPPRSQAKFNGLVNLGGEFEENAPPVFGSRASFGFRGNYWHPSGFSLNGEYLVVDTPGARVFGDPIFTGGNIQFNTPRYTAGWHGSFFEVWGGRDNLRWGPGRRGDLLVGGGTDYFGQVGYRVYLGTFVTATAVHGWLSQAEKRFVAFHRVEMDLGKGLRLGIAEGVRYDAVAPEPLYLLNLVPYSAVERILTSEGSTGADRDSLFRSNWMFTVDLHWRPSPGWAAYGEILIDDIQRDEGLFDPTQESGSPGRLGYQGGAVHIREGAHRLALQAEYTRVYNYTYAVFYGRDFFHRDQSLGYPLGADVADLNLWADLDLDLAWTLTGRAFHTRIGEGNNAGPWCSEASDEDRFGTDCQTIGPASGRAFAGTVERRMGFLTGAVYSPRDNLRLEASGGFAFVSNADHVDGVDETRPIAVLQASWRW